MQPAWENPYSGLTPHPPSKASKPERMFVRRRSSLVPAPDPIDFLNSPDFNQQSNRRRHSLESRHKPPYRVSEAWGATDLDPTADFDNSTTFNRAQTSSGRTRFADGTWPKTRPRSKHKQIIDDSTVPDSMALPGEVPNKTKVRSGSSSKFSRYRPLPAIGLTSPDIDSRNKDRTPTDRRDSVALTSELVFKAKGNLNRHSDNRYRDPKSKKKKHKSRSSSSSSESSAFDESTRSNELFHHVYPRSTQDTSPSTDSVINVQDDMDVSDFKPRPLIRSNTYEILNPTVLDAAATVSDTGATLQTAMSMIDLRQDDAKQAKHEANTANKAAQLHRPPSGSLTVPPTPTTKDEIVLAIRLPTGQKLYGYFLLTNTLLAVLKYAEDQSGEIFSDYHLVTSDVPKQVLSNLNQTIDGVQLKNRTLLTVQKKRKS